MAGSDTLKGSKNKKAQKLLERVVKVFDKIGMPYWLEGGTLLGIIRENRLLPWDNDMDLSIKDQSREDIDKLIHALKKEGLRTRLRYYLSEWELGTTADYRILKIRTKFLWFIKGPVVLEVFFKHTKDNEVHWIVDKTKKSVPADFYKEFTKVEFNNYKYSIPAKYEEYLTYRYGNWRVPKKDWNTFTDDQAINR